MEKKEFTEEELDKMTEEYKARFKERTGITPEEYVERLIFNRNKYQLTEIARYLKRSNKTLEEAIQEVKDKKSPLSASVRNVLVNVNVDKLKEWVC